MSVRDRENYLQNERNRFQSRIQSMTQEHFFSTGILQLKNIYCNWNITAEKIGIVNIYH